MMKVLLCLIFFTPLLTLSQQRVGLDISYKHGLNTTFSYHKVFSKNWLLSGTLTYGKKGKSYSHYLDYHSDIKNFQSPWQEMSQPIVEDNATYHLASYGVDNKSFNLQAGVGYFHNFDVTHGVRGHMFFQYGWAINDTYALYSSPEAISSKKRSRTFQHQLAAMSFEVYHTIQIWRKFTFYYGVKSPYYFQIDKSQYSPMRKDDVLNGLEPEISIGVTYLIGDC
ncbi:MAG: hypothetical protein ACQERC_06445 [Bacteroidota bacterium]